MLKQTTLVVAGLNALAALPHTPNLTTNAPAMAEPVAVLNQASLTAIEKSWLNLPRMCKARGAAFDPVVVGQEAITPAVAALYAQTVA